MDTLSRSQQKAIVISYAHTIANIADTLGCDKRRLLLESDIPQKLPADPFAFINLPQYESLLRCGLQQSGDPALGLKIGKGITFGHHGKLAFAALSHRTLWDAMKTGRKFSKVMNRVVDIQLEETDHDCVIRIESPNVGEHLYRIVIDMVMAMFLQQFRFMLKNELSDIRRLTICLRYDESCYGDVYQDILDPELIFGAEANKIMIPKKLAHASLEMSDPMIARQFEEECDRLLEQLDESRDIVDDVRRILFMASNGIPSLNDVADLLHVSPRTLRRHLQASDTSYQKILDQVRLELAQRYLSTSNRSIGEIAEFLGYKDQNSFSYAFKALTGLPPSQYRSNHSY